MDGEQFRDASRQLIDYVIKYLEDIRDRPVFPEVEPFYIRKLIPETAPEEPESWNEILKDVERVIMPGVSNRFHLHLHLPLVIDCQ